MENNEQISDDRRLGGDRKLRELVFEEYERTAVRDQETGEKIPGLRRSKFLLSVPYHAGERVKLANPNGRFGRRDFLYEWKSMTAEIAGKMTGRYFENDESIGEYRLLIDRVKTAVYKEPGVSLNKGYPSYLNAFEVGGTLYQWDKRDDQETTGRRPAARSSKDFFRLK